MTTFGNILFFPISLFFKILLFSWGWWPLTREIVDDFKSDKKCIFIYAHTTFWDYIIFTIYKLAYPYLGDNMYTLVSRKFFINKYINYFLNKTNCISTPLLEDKKTGFVESICNTLKNKDEYYLTISPEGRLKASRWRSGYYIIAKELKVPIKVVSLDFEKKMIVYFDSVKIEDYPSKNYLEEDLMNKMSQVVPLYPGGSYVEVVRTHSSIHYRREISVIDSTNLGVFFLLITIILNLYYLSISFLSFEMYLFFLPYIVIISTYNNLWMFIPIYTAMYTLIYHMTALIK